MWHHVGEQITATVHVDGKDTFIKLNCKQPTPNGISYAHFYNPAEATDPHGVSILRTRALLK